MRLVLLIPILQKRKWSFTVKGHSDSKSNSKDSGFTGWCFFLGREIRREGLTLKLCPQASVFPLLEGESLLL